MGYSWRQFHRVLPSYFAAQRLESGIARAALLGNLVSPSRGLVVCVPLVISIALLLVRYRQAVVCRSLAVLAGAVVCAHLAMLSGFRHWWGGHCFGARLTGSLVPWIVILAILAVDACRKTIGSRGANAKDFAWVAAAGLLGVASVFINSVGAVSRETELWNVNPDIDATPERLWSWKRPQWLAPFIEPTEPLRPLPGDGVRLGGATSADYLGLGWSGGEGDYRWTDGHHATVRFARPDVEEGFVEIEARPYLGEGRIPAQRLVISLNGRALGSFSVREPGFALYAAAVPGGIVGEENRLRLELPDAASPLRTEGKTDRRKLGLAVRLIRWRVVR